MPFNLHIYDIGVYYKYCCIELVVTFAVDSRVFENEYFASVAVVTSFQFHIPIPLSPSFVRSSARMRGTLSSGALASNVSDGRVPVIDQSKADHVTTVVGGPVFFYTAVAAVGESVGLVTGEN